MLIDAQKSSLLVIDIQEKLLPAIDDWQRTLDAVIWLTQLAKRVGVPVMASEQYPKGLGHTHPDLAVEFSTGSVATKMYFSCVPEGCLSALPGNEREQVVVCGTEAHVCVLQTVLDLLAAGKKVFVVADAVGSRTPENKEMALQRMRQNGAEIVSGEMVAFEWLRMAGTPLFREVSREFLR